MRLIDADELIEQMEADAEHIEDAVCKLMHYALIRDIKHQPTVDPVKHGRWVERGQYKDYVALHILQCSICGGHIVIGNDVDRYCKWCGAKMDGENDEID